MKFFHVGDLHFGKTLYNVPLAESDQPYWVEQFLKAVDKHDPDAIVIAGDVYDRKIPSPEAMVLFDHLITELYKRDKYVFVIPGNHDSAVRLSHVNELLAEHKIYISGEVKRELLHIALPGDDGDVVFWLMPYIFPKIVADESVLNEPDITTYDAAARALLKAQPIDETACNILIAHQNVLANGVTPEHSDSETFIGGLGEIDHTAFDAFDYVALGHIHNAQKIGRDTIRYSGCPLYYDFSEINRDKSLSLVTVRSKTDISIEQIEIPMLHRLFQISGTLEELKNAGISLENREQYYIQCVLKDKYVPSRALEQLREVYGDALVNVKRDLSEVISANTSLPLRGEGAALSLEEQFGMFFREQQKELLDGAQEQLVMRILDQQSRRGSDYIQDSKAIPREDAQELIDFLLESIKEEGE